MIVNALNPNVPFLHFSYTVLYYIRAGTDFCTCVGGYWWEIPKEKDHSEDRGVDGRMGSKWTLVRLVGEGVEWIHLAQDRDRWRAVVNAVMNPRVLAPWSYNNAVLQKCSLAPQKHIGRPRVGQPSYYAIKKGITLRAGRYFLSPFHLSTVLCSAQLPCSIPRTWFECR
jgi:hypothetical protein